MAPVLYVVLESIKEGVLARLLILLLFPSLRLGQVKFRDLDQLIASDLALSINKP